MYADFKINGTLQVLSFQSIFPDETSVQNQF